MFTESTNTYDGDETILVCKILGLVKLVEEYYHIIIISSNYQVIIIPNLVSYKISLIDFKLDFVFILLKFYDIKSIIQIVQIESNDIICEYSITYIDFYIRPWNPHSKIYSILNKLLFFSRLIKIILLLKS